MTAQDVIELIQLFEQNHIEVVIDGGWAVDALLGRPTRLHDDLDVAVLHKDVPQIRALLEARGYSEVPRNDSWECNFVLEDDMGHSFDLHSCTFDENGKNIFGVDYPFDSWSGHGTIGGYPVRCVPPDWLVKFHTGYKVDANDYHDVSLLCQAFGLPLPEEYAGFVNENQ
jgi:lincosamide nucleotidyltransferase A/C/D/E